MLKYPSQDKCPDDPQAAAKFQLLGTAYQTLSNEQSRAAYDKNGKPDGAATLGMEADIDPLVFFAVMFGSVLVEPYIGELWIATTADSVLRDALEHGEKDDDTVDEAVEFASQAALSEEGKLKQRKREVKCALNFRKRIQDYCTDLESLADFTSSCQKEAVAIGKGVYGGTFLTTIGYTLTLECDEYLGFQTSFLGLEGHAARAKKRMNAMRNNISIVGAGIKAAQVGRRAYQDVEKMQQTMQQSVEDDPVKRRGSVTRNQSHQGFEKSESFKQNTKRPTFRKGMSEASFFKNPSTATTTTEEEDVAQAMLAAQKLEETLPALLELAWAVNVRDISRTLKKVCKKLFNDAAVSIEMRHKRAEALRILGQEFYAVGRVLGGNAPDNNTSSDIKARAEVAVMTTMAKVSI